VADVTSLVQGAIGGENISTFVSGRERYPINIRYPRGIRDSLPQLAATRVAMPNGEQVPLGEIAKLSINDGPSEIKSENARLVGYVYINIADRDLGSYIADAKAELSKSVQPMPGYAIKWAGQYENMEHAKQKLYVAVPLTLALILLLLYALFRNWHKVLLVMLCLPFSLIGGFWLVYILGYHFSVAVAIGFIALAGVAAEFGVVMLLYLDNAIESFRDSGRLINARGLTEAIMHGAAMRLRPKMMTVSVIVAGLLPVMFSNAIGTDVMKRIAAPLIGGMVTAPLLSLIVIPTLYLWWHENNWVSPSPSVGPLASSPPRGEGS
jgi:Cu(I)/Ag(I) efflux system membrane protein CusA/SilA